MDWLSVYEASKKVWSVLTLLFMVVLLARMFSSRLSTGDRIGHGLMFLVLLFLFLT